MAEADGLDSIRLRNARRETVSMNATAAYKSDITSKELDTEEAAIDLETRKALGSDNNIKRIEDTDPDEVPEVAPFRPPKKPKKDFSAMLGISIKREK